jgi:hypothetical protein
MRLNRRRQRTSATRGVESVASSDPGQSVLVRLKGCPSRLCRPRVAFLTLIAVFFLAPPAQAAATTTYKVELVGNGTGGVVSNESRINCRNVPGEEKHECGSSEFGFVAELTAIPGPGSVFEGWTGAEVGSCSSGTANPCEFNPGFFGEVTITAEFGSAGPTQTLQVAKLGSGAGAITSSPDGIECGSNCEAEFGEGTVVVLTAEPNEHSTFAGWSGCGNVTTEDKCEITMSEAKSIEAIFAARPQETLEVIKTGAGSGEVSSAPVGIECGGTCTSHFNEGSTVTLTADPARGIPGTRYVFVGWTGCGTVTAEDTCEITMSDAERVEADFASIAQQTLQVQTAGSGAGEITSSPSGISCGGICEAEFAEGSVVTLNATPTPGSVFEGWSGGGCAGTGPCQVTLTTSTTVIANIGPVPSPTASTGEAALITSTTATLSGMVNGQGFDTHYLFYFGETTGYGGEVPSNGLGEDAGLVAIPTAEKGGLTGLAPNTTYHYRFVAYNVPCPSFCPRPGPNTVEGTDHTFTTLPLAPAVITDVAESVGIDKATVAGDIVTQGADTEYQVEYGSTEALGSSTPPTDVGATTTGQLVSVNLQDLSPGTTYYYRFAASNQGGKEYGARRTFTTSGLVPSAETGTASEIQPTTAVISGWLDPEGSDTTYRFQYGPTTTYGFNAPDSPVDGGAGVGPEQVSVAVVGLHPTESYHYRLVAINAAGVSYGVDHTFTTGAIAPSPLTALGPLRCRKGQVKRRGTCLKKPRGNHRHKKRKHEPLARAHTRNAHNDRRSNR